MKLSMDAWSVARATLLLGAVVIFLIDSQKIPNGVGWLALLSSFVIGWAQAGYSARSTSSDRTTSRVLFWLAIACMGLQLLRIAVDT